VIPGAANQTVGRFAPSPTGALHCGSLVAAVGSYLMAKQGGGRWLLRLDDLDTRRQVPGMADDIMRTLESFALYWDGAVSRQSDHGEKYEHFFAALQQSGTVYPCGCSRAEIARSASAPHIEDDCIPYPGSCRSGMRVGAPIRSWRVRVDEDELCFSDLRRGRICQTLPAASGDFILRRGDGEFAYQLAVVVDDFITGVTQVVRGDDLLASTPRQIYLQQLLGLPRPTYCHLPLVTGPQGSKLSKRDHLVSYQLTHEAGGERSLLHATLRFLGLNPPPDLSKNSCEEILQWGVAHFTSHQLPETGGELGL
jgi:glutamyl-Q tRNA(Asp) synthetase